MGAAGDDLLYFEAYAKWGQPPGWAYGQDDFRAHSGWGDEESLQDMELTFDRSMNGFQSGWLPTACRCTMRLSESSHELPAFW